MGKRKSVCGNKKHKKDKSKDQPDSQEARVAAVLKVGLKHSKQTSEPKRE